MNIEQKILNRWRAFDAVLYVEEDEGLFCVLGDFSGFCYHTDLDRAAAVAEGKRIAAEHCIQFEGS